MSRVRRAQACRQVDERRRRRHRRQVSPSTHFAHEVAFTGCRTLLVELVRVDTTPVSVILPLSSHV